jgi:hypothetical protein
MDLDKPNVALEDGTESLKRFRRGEDIIHEAEPTDNQLYLLQEGSVGIYRKVENCEVIIEKIDPVNFFGEIEIFCGGPRLATVRALSDEVVTYRFLINDPHNVNLPGELGQLLLRRLSSDLKDYANRYLKNERCINNLLDEKDGSLSNSAVLITAIQTVLNSAARSSRYSGADMQIITALESMISKFISRKLPLMKNRLETQDPVDFRVMYEDNLIPDELVHILLSQK